MLIQVEHLCFSFPAEQTSRVKHVLERFSGVDILELALPNASQPVKRTRIYCSIPRSRKAKIFHELDQFPFSILWYSYE